MILELATLLGASGGGKILGMFSDFMSERRLLKQQELEQNHLQDLASRGSLGEYLNGINEPNEITGCYSPMAWTVAIGLGVFTITYCIAALSCFVINPQEIVWTKDPSSKASEVELLWGFIGWKIADNRVVEVSKIGVGFLMLHPVVFIISMVFTGDKPKRR